MKNGYGYRIAGIVLGVVALVALAGLWFSSQTDFLFVPLLLAVAGSICAARYKRLSE